MGTGPAPEVVEIVNKLKAKNVFAREVHTHGIAHHSADLDDGIPELRAGMQLHASSCLTKHYKIHVQSTRSAA